MFSVRACAYPHANLLLAGPVHAGECFTRSTLYTKLCFSSDRCNDACLEEGKGYSGGKCLGLKLYCQCITPCATTTAAAPV